MHPVRGGGEASAGNQLNEIPIRHQADFQGYTRYFDERLCPGAPLLSVEDDNLDLLLRADRLDRAESDLQNRSLIIARI